MQVYLVFLIYPPPFSAPLAACGTPLLAKQGYLLNSVIPVELGK